jgi:uncharacterized protein (DUF934 family)
MRIIKDRKIVDDSFVQVASDAEIPAQGDIVVGLDRYRELREQLTQRKGRVGVRLKSSEEAAQVADLLPEVALVAVEFPGFKDGRGYTTGRLLRERHGYRGELRAVGDVMRDQLFYMERCGFNAFEVKAGKPLESAVQAFSEYSVTYQGAADDPRPLFRRRAG